MLRPTAILVLCGLAIIVEEVQTCNEAVCGPIVSKCLLTQSCKCEFRKDCSCCKECAYCLSYLYSECCSCLDMCPKPNETRSDLSKQSYVQDFTSKFLELFDALTEAPDSQNRWTIYTYPVDVNIDNSISVGPKADMKLQLQSVEQESAPVQSNATTLNCTVAYMAKCMSWEKCKENCQSMGASSMRWFHDGCCECIGEYCINYGINESRCLKCSKYEGELADLSDDEKDFGEDYDYALEDYEGLEDNQAE